MGFDSASAAHQLQLRKWPQLVSASIIDFDGLWMSSHWKGQLMAYQRLNTWRTSVFATFHSLIFVALRHFPYCISFDKNSKGLFVRLEQDGNVCRV